MVNKEHAFFNGSIFIIHHFEFISEMLNLQIPMLDIPDASTLLKVCFSVAWLLGVSFILHLTYKFILNYTLVTANCWFCNQDSRVSFKQKNEWICPRCEQFNGFTKDGNYSKSIPEQHHEPLGIKKLNITTPTRNNLSSSNGLCRTCNANQELKIRQIASYVPLREADYDQEIELFKEKLERSYELCPVCARTVQNTLKLKSRQYCTKNIRKTENYFTKMLTKKDHPKKRKHWITLLLTTITVLLLWNFFEFSELVIESRTRIKWPVISYPVSISGDFVSNLLVLISTVLFTKNHFGMTTVLSSILIGILSLMTHDHVSLTLKNAYVISTLIYFVLKRTEKRPLSVDSFHKLSKKHLESDFEDECGENVQENNQKQNIPICGNFSDLSLGGTPSISSSSKTSYLFRSSKLLVQPPKLILDDMNDSAITLGSFHTASSGYDSVTTFLRKTPDSVSEFDSVSQVGYKRFSGSSRGSPNALVSFPGPRTVHAPTYEQFYGVSSHLKTNQRTSVLNTSESQTSAFFSALQIFLCSFAFFILGFSFQLLISYLRL